MGMTMQQLGTTMTAQEFGQHYAMEVHEPLPAAQWSGVASVLASLANGPLQSPEAGRNWSASDFMPALWCVADEVVQAEPEMTVDEIMARARMAGMVQ